MEPTLGVKLLCVVPHTLAAVGTTAYLLNFKHAEVYYTLSVQCNHLWVYSMYINHHYARRYRSVLVVYTTFVQRIWLWRICPMAVIFPLGVLLAVIIGPQMPRQRLERLLSRML